MSKLTNAEQVVYDLAEEIASNIISKETFLIPNYKYDEVDKDEIIRLLLNIEEIENVIPNNDGLSVFVF